MMSKKEKKAQQMLEKISLFKAAGFTDEQIKKHFNNKIGQENARKAKLRDAKKNKPLARIYKGLNTNAM